MGEQRVGYMALRVSVSGRMNEPKFQKAKAAAEALAEFHGDQVQAEIQEMVPAEWDIFREKKTSQLCIDYGVPLNCLRCRLGARRSPAQQDSQDFPTCVERCRGWEDMLHRGLGCIHELGQR